MPKNRIEAPAFVAFDYPITEMGHYAMPEDSRIVHRRNPKRTEFIVRNCPACGGEHALVFQDG